MGAATGLLDLGGGSTRREDGVAAVTTLLEAQYLREEFLDEACKAGDEYSNKLKQALGL